MQATVREALPSRPRGKLPMIPADCTRRTRDLTRYDTITYICRKSFSSFFFLFLVVAFTFELSHCSDRFALSDLPHQV